MLRKQDINFDEWNKMDNTKKRELIKKFADLVMCNGASKDFLHFLLQETVIMAEAGMFSPPDIVTEYTMDHLRAHIINYFYNKGYGEQTEKEADDLLKFLERITFQHEGNDTINEIEIKRDCNPQGELPFKYQLGCTTTKKSVLDERYKIVDIETIPHEPEKIINIDLWTNEKKENDYHINILIANHKLIYSGDCGTFVFGSGICTTRPVYYFFCGSKTNPLYWREKCEASSDPIVNDNVDLEKLNDELEIYSVDFDWRQVEDAKIKAGYPWFSDANPVRVYDLLCKIFEELGDTDNWKAAETIIKASRTLNERYIYACEVIQWVCNMLQKKEGEIKYAVK
ncbi:hypothetical protein [Treponema pedis]|uniref:hypothetical protein n=1 Tax=Treponema pedis TaxID=409322 RepID=UPI0003FA3E88|nr:hypothetical protein [Treponema pedis]